MEYISQHLKNLASDYEISALIPRAFAPLEIVAAATSFAREIAGNDEPNRHDYQKAIPAYLKSLPNSQPLALDVIKLDAAQVLGIPGLVTDHAVLSAAQ